MQSRIKARKAAPTLARAGGWTFVNLSEPKQSKDEGLRAFVRSNAMRDYRQKKRRNEMKDRRQPENITARHEFGESLYIMYSDPSQ